MSGIKVARLVCGVLYSCTCVSRPYSGYPGLGVAHPCAVLCVCVTTRHSGKDVGKLPGEFSKLAVVHVVVVYNPAYVQGIVF